MSGRLAVVRSNVKLLGIIKATSKVKGKAVWGATWTARKSVIDSDRKKWGVRAREFYYVPETEICWKH